MAIAYVTKKIKELGGVTKIGICDRRFDLKERFYSMKSKHDYPELEVLKEVYVDKDFLPQLRFWEKALKNKFSAKQNKVYRKKHIYTIVGERTYDYIWEQDTPANGGTEFYLLDDDDIKEVLISMENLEKKCNDTNWFKPSDDFKLDGTE